MADKNDASQVWLITGCSSGFGREFAHAALRHGYRVVATARDTHTLSDLLVEYGECVRALELDVTKADRIRDVIAEAEHAFGGGIGVEHLPLLV